MASLIQAGLMLAEDGDTLLSDCWEAYFGAVGADQIKESRQPS